MLKSLLFSSELLFLKTFACSLQQKWLYLFSSKSLNNKHILLILKEPFNCVSSEVKKE